MEKQKIGFFEKYLSVWVGLCIVIGVAIGQYLPFIPKYLSYFEYANVSLPITILIWIMIYPMMLKVDFSSIFSAVKKPKGLALTLITNWLIKPFTMFFFAYIFFNYVFKAYISPELAKEYIAGAVLLGAAPCTAMVFVWSYLTKGDSGYTVVQVAINDLIILIAFTPIVAFLLGISDIIVPFDTLILSVVLFVVIPLVFGMFSRKYLIAKRGDDYFNNVFLPKFHGVTVMGLLLTLVIIFSFQGNIIISNPVHIFLISIPLVIQTVFIFIIAYLAAYIIKLPHNIACPAAMIGASNFFELAVAVSIALFGLNSGATHVTFNTLHTLTMVTDCPPAFLLLGMYSSPRDVLLKEASAGNLPIHNVASWELDDEEESVCRKSMSWATLMSACPESVDMKNDFGETP